MENYWANFKSFSRIQIAFYAFHSFVVDVQSNAGYIRTKHAQKQPED